MIKKIKSRLQNRVNSPKKGFTLVEILVAVTVFSIVVVPLMAGFVTSSRITYAARVNEQAMTIAQNLMEGVKNFGVAELSKQCNTSSEITIIAINDPAKKAKGTEVLPISYTDMGGNDATYAETSYGSVFTEHPSVSQGVGSVVMLNGSVLTGEYYCTIIPYQFKIENILLGSTYYDAVITLTQDTSAEYNIFSFAEISSYYNELKLIAYKYYNVEIQVSVHGEDKVRATYSGTIRDNK